MTITQNVNSILHELPPNVQLLAAGKSRDPKEVEEAVAAGIKIIGENYVQEAKKPGRQSAKESNGISSGTSRRTR